MKIKIGDKVYDNPVLDTITVRDIILFDGEVRDLRADLGWTWADVERVSEEAESLSEAEFGRHPDKYFYFATLIWAAHRLHGEHMTFSDAVDIPPSQVTFIDEPQDHKPGKSKGPKKARKVSAPVVSLAEVDEAETTPPPEDSVSESIPA